MFFHDPILSLSSERDVSSYSTTERPQVQGKFLYQGNTKLWIRGVTYGTFRPNVEGDQFPPALIVAQDFSRIAEHGFNAVRLKCMRTDELPLIDGVRKAGPSPGLSRSS